MANTLAEVLEKKKDNVSKAWKDEELEAFEEMVDKTYTRKGETKTDYFYRVVSTHPKSIGIGEMEFIPQFNVQKYFRNRKIEVSVEGGKRKEKRYEAVAQFDQGGKLLDSDASFFIDCPDFVTKYEQAQV